MPRPIKTFKVKTKDNNPKTLHFENGNAVLSTTEVTWLGIDSDQRWTTADGTKYMRESTSAGQIELGDDAPDWRWDVMRDNDKDYLRYFSDDVTKWAYEAEGKVMLGNANQRNVELVMEDESE